MSEPQRTEEPAGERPRCVAIIICNEVIEDKRTNNKTLVGLFNGIAVRKLPARQAKLCVLISLTDGRGEWPVTLTVRDPDGGRVFEAQGQGVFRDPLAVHDLVMEIQGLPLARAGEYHVDLACGGTHIASRRFTVIEKQG